LRTSAEFDFCEEHDLHMDFIQDSFTTGVITMYSGKSNVEIKLNMDQYKQLKDFISEHGIDEIDTW
jgi:hypothetical protein